MSTLQEVSNIVGMSRRVIQEYEKAGLAKTPEARDEQGRLKYTDADVDRLWQIRFYRELGYDKKTIRAILDDPEFNRKKAIEEQVQLLIKKKENLEGLIAVAKTMSDDINPIVIQSELFGLNEMPYDDFVFMTSRIWTQQKVDEDTKYTLEEYLEENVHLEEADADKLYDAIELIIEFCDQKTPYMSEETQAQVDVIYNIIAKSYWNSIFALWLVKVLLVPSSEIAIEFDEAFRKGGREYLYNAIAYYYKAHEDVSLKQEMLDALNNIDKLGKKRYTTQSAEVQNEVERLYWAFTKMVPPGMDILASFEYYAEMIGSEDFKKRYDKGRKHGIFWFASRAMQIYCENQKKHTMTVEHS